ncbi:hypothetical protein GW17_00016501, partial [Ensete ventricosum]
RKMAGLLASRRARKLSIVTRFHALPFDTQWRTFAPVGEKQRAPPSAAACRHHLPPMTMMTPPPLDVLPFTSVLGFGVEPEPHESVVELGHPLTLTVASRVIFRSQRWWFLLDLSADLCASIFAAGGRGDAGPAPRVHRGTPAHGRYSLFVILV